MRTTIARGSPPNAAHAADRRGWAGAPLGQQAPRGQTEEPLICAGGTMIAHG
jgi:hypothetical protein